MTPNLNSIQEKTDSFDYIKIKGKKGFTAKNTRNKRESQMKRKNIYICNLYLGQRTNISNYKITF